MTPTTAKTAFLLLVLLGSAAASVDFVEKILGARRLTHHLGFGSDGWPEQKSDPPKLKDQSLNKKHDIHDDLLHAPGYGSEGWAERMQDYRGGAAQSAEASLFPRRRAPFGTRRASGGSDVIQTVKAEKHPVNEVQFAHADKKTHVFGDMITNVALGVHEDDDYDDEESDAKVKNAKAQPYSLGLKSYKQVKNIEADESSKVVHAVSQERGLDDDLFEQLDEKIFHRKEKEQQQEGESRRSGAFKGWKEASRGFLDE